MRQKNILFLGYGDVAARAARRLPNYAVTAISRSTKPVPPHVQHIQGAVDAPALWDSDAMRKKKWDAVIITLTPTDMSDEAYKMAYVDTVHALIRRWSGRKAPKLVLFASSTSVYGQDDGSWVDEDSPTLPSSYAGRRLLEAEQALASSGLNAVTVRFAGIYGPGRDYLLRQVREGKGGDERFTNRLHADDCAGVLVHLMELCFSGRSLEPLYLACDNKPAPSSEVRTWLADQMGISRASLQISTSSRGGNKRCSNHRLLSSGYRLAYPSYKDGYKTLLP